MYNKDKVPVLYPPLIRAGGTLRFQYDEASY